MRQALTYAFDFESMNRTLFYRLQHAHRQLLRRAGTGLQRPADGQGTGNPRRRTRTSCRRNCSRRNSSCRSTTRRRPSAQYLQRGRRAVRRGRLEDQRRQDGQRRRPASSSRSRFSATTRPTRSSPPPSSTICASSASTPRCASSTPANTSTASTISTSTCITAVLAQSHSPGNEQRDFWSHQGRRHAGLAQPVGHQGPGRRRAGRAGHLRDRPRRSGRRDPCARPRAAVELLRRAAIAPAVSGSPTGTSSAFRKSSRLYRRRHRFLVDRPRQGGRAAGQVQGPELMRNARADTPRLPGARRRGRCLRRSCPGRHSRQCPTEPAAARALRLRRPEIRAGLHAFRLRRTRTRRRAAPSISRRRSWVFNQNPYTFNTLNSFVAKGDAPPRMEICFDSLMASALDEPDSIYGLLAEDRDDLARPQQLRIRAEAGSAVPRRLAADRRGRRLHVQAAQGKRPSGSAAVADRTDRSRRARRRETATDLLGKAIRPHHPRRRDFPDPFQGVFRQGSVRQFAHGAAARVGTIQGRACVNAGQTIEYERVADYWGRDLPVNRGMLQFRPHPDRILRRQAGGVRGVQEGRGAFPRGIRRRASGRPATTSRRSTRERS